MSEFQTTIKGNSIVHELITTFVAKNEIIGHIDKRVNNELMAIGGTLHFMIRE